VRIAAVVTDRQGRAVPGLTVKTSVWRRRRRQTIEASRRGEAPRRIAILLDKPHADAADAPRVRDAVSAFVATRLAGRRTGRPQAARSAHVDPSDR
jgi:hypothetical protein